MVDPIAGKPGNAPGMGAPKGPDKLKEATEEFEAFFLQMILKQMRAANHALSDQPASFARDTYEGWQDEEMARQIARAGGTGLGEVLYRQLQQQQLSQTPPAADRKNPSESGNTSQ